MDAVNRLLVHASTGTKAVDVPKWVFCILAAFGVLALCMCFRLEHQIRRQRQEEAEEERLQREQRQGRVKKDLEHRKKLIDEKLVVRKYKDVNESTPPTTNDETIQEGDEEESTSSCSIPSGSADEEESNNLPTPPTVQEEGDVEETKPNSISSGSAEAHDEESTNQHNPVPKQEVQEEPKSLCSIPSGSADNEDCSQGDDEATCSMHSGSLDNDDGSQQGGDQEQQPRRGSMLLSRMGSLISIFSECDGEQQQPRRGSMFSRRGSMFSSRMGSMRSVMTDYDDMCGICLTTLENDDLVGQSSNPDCCHVYHEECIKSWLLKKDECPFCRLTFLPDAELEEE